MKTINILLTGLCLFFFSAVHAVHGYQLDQERKANRLNQASVELLQSMSNWLAQEQMVNKIEQEIVELLQMVGTDHDDWRIMAVTSDVENKEEKSQMTHEGLQATRDRAKEQFCALNELERKEFITEVKQAIIEKRMRRVEESIEEGKLLIKIPTEEYLRLMRESQERELEMMLPFARMVEEHNSWCEER